jgi:hypothetical protein
MDRKQIKAGMFLTSGSTANPILTKVHAAETVEEIEAIDKRFLDAQKLAEAIALTKKTLEALRGKP